MTRDDIIKQYIKDIKQSKYLSGTTGAQVELINNQYILKSNISDGDEVCAWYEHNYTISPELIYYDNNHILYKSIAESGSLTSEGLIEFLLSYKPKLVGECDTTYFKKLEEEYLVNCEKFKLRVIKSSFPNNQKCYALHGDMGIHNLLIEDNCLKIIDPEPRLGPVIHDLIQFYVSSPIIIKMVNIEKFKDLIGSEHFDFYYLRILADRIMRCSYHHPEDLPFYLTLYNDYIDSL